MCSKDFKIDVKKFKSRFLKKARGKYVVAEFLPYKDVEEITIEAIPGYWLGECATPFFIPLEKNIIQTHMFAYIPANENSRYLRKAKIENTLPDVITWIKWPIRFVLGTIFENYQDARQEEAKAESYPHSDLEGYKAGTTERCRVSNKMHWSSDTSDNSDSDVETLSVERDPLLVASGVGTLSDPPPLIIIQPDQGVSQSGGNEIDIDLMDEDLSGDLHCQSDHPPQLDVIQTKIDCSLSAVESAGNITFQGNSRSQESLASTSKSSYSDMTSEIQSSLVVPDVSEGLSPEVHIRDKDVLNMLEEGKPPDDFYKMCLLRLLNRTAEIESRVLSMEKGLETLTSTEGAINDKERLECEALLPLPISSKEGLTLLNTTLKINSRYFTFLVLWQNLTFMVLQRLFMKDACPIPTLLNYDSKTVKQELQKLIGHIYPRIMTNQLALQYNLFGRNINPNSPQKESFKQFDGILTVTYEAIKPKALMAKLNLDKVQSDGAVGEWLRQAGNRVEEKKEFKKRRMAELRAAAKIVK